MKFLIYAGSPRATSNILSGKYALIITSVGGSESNYSKEGKYKTRAEDLLIGLQVSLDINDIELKKTHIIYNADNPDEKQLDVFCEELSEILEIK